MVIGGDPRSLLGHDSTRRVEELGAQLLHWLPFWGPGFLLWHDLIAAVRGFRMDRLRAAPS